MDFGHNLAPSKRKLDVSYVCRSQIHGNNK